MLENLIRFIISCSYSSIQITKIHAHLLFDKCFTFKFDKNTKKCKLFYSYELLKFVIKTNKHK